MKNIFTINRIGARKSLRLIKLPFIVIFVVISTIVACILGRDLQIFGFNIQGYVWVFSLCLSIFVLMGSIKLISFPWYLWLPWILFIIIYLIIFPNTNALQRTAMMICPIIVGVAISTCRIQEEQLKSFYRMILIVTLFFFLFVLIKTGIIFTGKVPELTGLAAQVMTGSLLACYFICEYIYGNRNALGVWIGLSLVPIIAMTRTGIVATAITFPLTLAPIKFKTRVIIIFLIGILGLGVFYTERFQRKMFYSGEGTISDLRYDNPDLYTAGRKAMWERMEAEIEDSPWWGYGANATDDFLLFYTGFATHPHNDWLRLRYDYGYIGTFIFAICMVAQTLHAWKKGARTLGRKRLLFYTGASAFIPFALFMTTDNIILYCAFFGNLQFAILGLAYASLKTEQNNAKQLLRIKNYLPINFKFPLRNDPIR